MKRLHNLPRHALRALVAVTLCYLAMLCGLYLFQRDLVFHPERDTKGPEEYGLSGFRETILSTEDKESLQLWSKKAKTGYPTVVYFQGNALTLGNRARRLAEIAKSGFGVLAVSYRGFGKSTGSPSEEGFFTDARTVMSYATTTLGIPSRQMILYGESLGTAVATYAATQYAVGGVILEAPPRSILARGQELYPFMPIAWLLKDRFETEQRIGAIEAPLLILHGDQDSVVPVAHGKALYVKASAPKRLVVFKGGEHVGIPAPRVAEEVRRFARKIHFIK